MAAPGVQPIPFAMEVILQAQVIDSFGPPDKLHSSSLPMPEPGAGEVLISVRGAGVNPIDAKTRAGRGVPVPRFPAVLGWDVSGEVAATGPSTRLLRKGDAVFGMLRFPEIASAYAEYVVGPEQHLAHKPEALDHRAAAAAPMVALTAWQALFEHARVEAGQRVLVHGASGGVGHIAVQLARWKGAHVIGTASARNHDFLRQIGAREVVDYSRQPLGSSAKDVDVVIDSRGGDDFLALLGVLRDGGTIVSLVGAHSDGSKAAAAKGVRTAFMVVRPDNSALAEVAALLAQRTIEIAIDRVFPLNDAPAAHTLIETGHVRGRVVLEIPAD